MSTVEALPPPYVPPASFMPSPSSRADGGAVTSTSEPRSPQRLPSPVPPHQQQQHQAVPSPNTATASPPSSSAAIVGRGGGGGDPAVTKAVSADHSSHRLQPPGKPSLPFTPVEEEVDADSSFSSGPDLDQYHRRGIAEAATRVPFFVRLTIDTSTADARLTEAVAAAKALGATSEAPKEAAVVESSREGLGTPVHLAAPLFPPPPPSPAPANADPSSSPSAAAAATSGSAHTTTSPKPLTSAAVAMAPSEGTAGVSRAEKREAPAEPLASRGMAGGAVTYSPPSSQAAQQSPLEQQQQQAPPTPTPSTGVASMAGSINGRGRRQAKKGVMTLTAPAGRTAVPISKPSTIPIAAVQAVVSGTIVPPPPPSGAPPTVNEVGMTVPAAVPANGAAGPSTSASHTPPGRPTPTTRSRSAKTQEAQGTTAGGDAGEPDEGVVAATKVTVERPSELAQQSRTAQGERARPPYQAAAAAAAAVTGTEDTAPSREDARLSRKRRETVTEAPPAPAPPLRQQFSPPQSAIPAREEVILLSSIDEGVPSSPATGTQHPAAVARGRRDPSGATRPAGETADDGKGYSAGASPLLREGGSSGRTGRVPVATMVAQQNASSAHPPPPPPPTPPLSSSPQQQQQQPQHVKKKKAKKAKPDVNTSPTLATDPATLTASPHQKTTAKAEVIAVEHGTAGTTESNAPFSSPSPPPTAAAATSPSTALVVAPPLSAAGATAAYPTVLPLPVVGQSPYTRPATYNRATMQPFATAEVAANAIATGATAADTGQTKTVAPSSTKATAAGAPTEAALRPSPHPAEPSPKGAKGVGRPHTMAVAGAAGREQLTRTTPQGTGATPYYTLANANAVPAAETPAAAVNGGGEAARRRTRDRAAVEEPAGPRAAPEADLPRTVSPSPRAASRRDGSGNRNEGSDRRARRPREPSQAEYHPLPGFFDGGGTNPLFSLETLTMNSPGRAGAAGTAHAPAAGVGGTESMVLQDISVDVVRGASEGRQVERPTSSIGGLTAVPLTEQLDSARSSIGDGRAAAFLFCIEDALSDGAGSRREGRGGSGDGGGRRGVSQEKAEKGARRAGAETGPTDQGHGGGGGAPPPTLQEGQHTGKITQGPTKESHRLPPPPAIIFSPAVEANPAKEVKEQGRRPRVAQPPQRAEDTGTPDPNAVVRPQPPMPLPAPQVLKDGVPSAKKQGKKKSKKSKPSRSGNEVNGVAATKDPQAATTFSSSSPTSTPTPTSTTTTTAATSPSAPSSSTAAGPQPRAPSHEKNTVVGERAWLRRAEEPPPTAPIASAAAVVVEALPPPSYPAPAGHGRGRRATTDAPPAVLPLPVPSTPDEKKKRAKPVQHCTPVDPPLSSTPLKTEGASTAIPTQSQPQQKSLQERGGQSGTPAKETAHGSAQPPPIPHAPAPPHTLAAAAPPVRVETMPPVATRPLVLPTSAAFHAVGAANNRARRVVPTAAAARPLPPSSAIAAAGYTTTTATTPAAAATKPAPAPHLPMATKERATAPSHPAVEGQARRPSSSPEPTAPQEERAAAKVDSADVLPAALLEQLRNWKVHPSPLLTTNNPLNDHHIPHPGAEKEQLEDSQSSSVVPSSRLSDVSTPSSAASHRAHHQRRIGVRSFLPRSLPIRPLRARSSETAKDVGKGQQNQWGDRVLPRGVGPQSSAPAPPPPAVPSSPLHRGAKGEADGLALPASAPTSPLPMNRYGALDGVKQSPLRLPLLRMAGPGAALTSPVPAAVAVAATAPAPAPLLSNTETVRSGTPVGQKEGSANSGTGHTNYYTAFHHLTPKWLRTTSRSPSMESSLRSHELDSEPPERGAGRGRQPSPPSPLPTRPTDEKENRMTGKGTVGGTPKQQKQHHQQQQPSFTPLHLAAAAPHHEAPAMTSAPITTTTPRGNGTGTARQLWAVPALSPPSKGQMASAQTGTTATPSTMAASPATAHSNPYPTDREVKTHTYGQMTASPATRATTTTTTTTAAVAADGRHTHGPLQGTTPVKVDGNRPAPTSSTIATTSAAVPPPSSASAASPSSKANTVASPLPQQVPTGGPGAPLPSRPQPTGTTAPSPSTMATTRDRGGAPDSAAAAPVAFPGSAHTTPLGTATGATIGFGIVSSGTPRQLTAITPLAGTIHSGSSGHSSRSSSFVGKRLPPKKKTSAGALLSKLFSRGSGGNSEKDRRRRGEGGRVGEGEALQQQQQRGRRRQKPSSTGTPSPGSASPSAAATGGEGSPQGERMAGVGVGDLAQPPPPRGAGRVLLDTGVPLALVRGQRADHDGQPTAPNATSAFAHAPPSYHSHAQPQPPYHSPPPQPPQQQQQPLLTFDPQQINSNPRNRRVWVAK